MIPLARSLFLSSLLLGSAASASADDFTTIPVAYSHDGVPFAGTIVRPAEAEGLLPGILMVPNWMGPTEASLVKAKKVASEGYVVMMADLYGVDVRPQNAAEAGQAAGTLRSDRALMRARAAKALAEFRDRAGVAQFDPTQVAAIGFCFGGGAVLELGRTGADLDAIVSFHGDLLSPTLAADAAQTQAKVLVLHGAADPYVPQSDVQEWIGVMLATGVDWQLHQFSGAVHSFTNPQAASPGQSQYDARTSERAFEMMEELFEELWETDED